MKILLMAGIVVLLLLQFVAVSAVTEEEARDAWREAKRVSAEKQALHRDAKAVFAGNQSEEHRQAVVSTGRDVLGAALDEAEGWLNWKGIEAENNPELPEDIKERINADVGTNLGKVAALRADVAGIDNQFELGLVFLKMVGSYVELVTDVARDTGKVLVFVGETQITKAEDYEEKLRQEAEGVVDNEAVIARLDMAKASLDEARGNVDKADASYDKVVLPGTPLIKFQEGNNYMRTAKTNLLSAVSSLEQAYNLMVRGG